MLRYLLLKILLNKEEEIMIAMLWAQKIMYGKKEFSSVPPLLREQVKEELVDSGFGHLAVTEE